MKSGTPFVGFLVLGLVVGFFVQVFQISLLAVVEFHRAHPSLIWGLPVAWILFELFHHWRLTRDAETTDQILHSVSHPGRPVQIVLAPLTYLRTLWSHLWGASVGREGAALQIAASLGTTLTRILPPGFFVTGSPWLRASLAAGLAAAYRTPLAACVLALELGGPTSRRDRGGVVLATFASYGVVRFVFSEPTWGFPRLDFEWSLLATPAWWFGLTLILLGAPLYRLFFLLLNRPVRHWQPRTKWVAAGVAGLLFFVLFRDPALRGLGTDLIENSFEEGTTQGLFALKILITVVFNVGGWFGGDFTPLMAIGAGLGSDVGRWTGFALPALFAAVSLFLPVGFGHRLLLTTWVMTFEIFGFAVAFAAFPVYFAGFFFSRWLEAHVFVRLHHSSQKQTK